MFKQPWYLLAYSSAFINSVLEAAPRSQYDHVSLTEASPLYIPQSTLEVMNLGNTLEENDV